MSGSKIVNNNILSYYLISYHIRTCLFIRLNWFLYGALWDKFQPDALKQFVLICECLLMSNITILYTLECKCDSGHRHASSSGK